MLAPHGGEVSTSSDPSEDKIPLDHHWDAQKVTDPSGSKPMPTFDSADVIGMTFLLPPAESGARHRVKVTRKVVEIIGQENGHREKILTLS